MIGVRLTGSDLARIRFAHSPLVEVTESLWMLSSRRVQPVHRPWFDETRGKLGHVDMELLHAVVPARPRLADFLLPGATGPEAAIERQLMVIHDLPSHELRRQLENVWRDAPMSPRARQLIHDGAAGPARLAGALWEYWMAAVEPYWREMRAIYDDDMAFRAATLTKAGVGELLCGLHPQISVDEHVLWIDKPHVWEQNLPAGGLVLVPSAFAWPNLVFESGSAGTASLTYAVRGVANLWEAGVGSRTDEGDALGALLGRTRAAILVSLALPHSTTELALELGVRPPSVSQHLAVLRRNGLVTSWRKGRCVLYRRTALATSILEAGTEKHRAAGGLGD